MNTGKSLHVALFAGCTVNFIDPGIGADALAVLAQNGIDVLYPDARCCGVPLLAYGNRKGFAQNAAFNMESLLKTGCDIVAPCSSCAHALREKYPARLGTAAARTIAARTYDLLQYLCVLARKGFLRMDFRRVELFALYHAPCHLKGFGSAAIDARLELLKHIPGVKVERIDRGCCGMGGTFGMKKKNYSQSVAIGAALARGIREARPDVVLTECPGCRMQIEHLSGVAAWHPVRLLALAYGWTSPPFEETDHQKTGARLQ